MLCASQRVYEVGHGVKCRCMTVNAEQEPATLPKARCGHGEDAVGDREDVVVVDETLPEPTTGNGEDEHPETRKPTVGNNTSFSRRPTVVGFSFYQMSLRQLAVLQCGATTFTVIAPWGGY